MVSAVDKITKDIVEKLRKNFDNTGLYEPRDIASSCKMSYKCAKKYRKLPYISSVPKVKTIVKFCNVMILTPSEIVKIPITRKNNKLNDEILKYKTLGERVKYLRTSRNLSQLQLGIFLGCSDPCVSRMEKENSNVFELSIELIIAICVYFKLDIDNLLQGYYQYSK